MAGIEVAGLILGAIPLIISGLEHYGEGVRTIKTIFNYSQEFASLSRKLRIENDIFRNAIEILLHDAVDDATVLSLLEQPGSTLWYDPSIQDGLKEKLRRSYLVFMETIQDMNKTIQEFIQRLRLTPDGKGPFNDPKSFKEAYKRFKFGLKKSAYMDLIEEIIRDNAALTKLTEQSRALEIVRLSRRRRIPDFESIRTYALSAFDTIQHSLRGSCRATHRASICLNESPRDKSTTKDITLRVVLHHASPGPAPSTVAFPWMVEEAEMRPLAAINNVVPQAPPATKMMKVTRFTDPDPSTVAAMQANLAEIRDLCSELPRLRMMHCGGEGCLGYLTDTQRSHRHGLYWPKDPIVDRSSMGTQSLGTLLAAKDRDRKLSGADSRQLAHSLALSVLRLYDTPWLSKEWSCNSVILFMKDNAYVARYPFMSTEVQLAPLALDTVQAGVQASNTLIRNETLFALGIMLIELCMQKPFDELAKTRNAGHTSSDDLVAAMRFIDEVYDQAGKRYGDAVRRCILCEFDLRNNNLNDPQFRRAVYEGVVAVLDEDVRQFLG